MVDLEMLVIKEKKQAEGWRCEAAPLKAWAEGPRGEDSAVSVKFNENIYPSFPPEEWKIDISNTDVFSLIIGVRGIPQSRCLLLMIGKERYSTHIVSSLRVGKTDILNTRRFLSSLRMPLPPGCPPSGLEVLSIGEYLPTGRKRRCELRGRRRCELRGISISPSRREE